MRIFDSVALGTILLILSACGGSSKSSSSMNVDKTQIMDLTPVEYSNFGTKVAKLVGGNIIVHEFQNSTFPSAGTIRVYNPTTAQLINTISGDDVDDRLGSGGIYPLLNGNFLIVSSEDDVGGLVDAGSVILADSDGVIISTISGDQEDDKIGSEGITILSNGTFLISSRFDDVGSIVDVGSVKLVDSSTGLEIVTLSSDDVNDNFANAGVFALSNGNFLISSTVDDIGGIDDVGSVKLVNGTTGVVIASIEGDQLGDNLGSGGIAVLNNGNFVISSWRDDIGSLVNGGSVKLVDGTTGAIIVSIEGDQDLDYYGTKPAVVLSNGNFVIALPNDDVGGLVDAGSVKVVDGVTGAILVSVDGDQASDFLGYNGILDGLSAGSVDGSFAIFSEFDDDGLMSNAGSIKIIDKNTNSFLFNIKGSEVNYRLGNGNFLLLSNKNFILYSSEADNGVLSNAGRVDLFNGLNGSLIISIKGDQDSDHLGGDGVSVLSNGNFVISSSQDDVNGLLDAGSVMLVDGASGLVLKQYKGKKSDDRISIGGTKVFSNGDFAFISDLEDVGAIDSAGTVRFVNGLSGKEYFSDKGQSSFDFQNGNIIELAIDEYLFATPGYNLDSNINTGRVIIYKR
jgi:hypothetical protein